MAGASARRGKFGNLPPASTSLASTIISIARDMENQQDSAITDAWKNGGLYQGKPVTDAMMIAYWHGRLKGIDKSDPLYDTYTNTVSQLEYSIAEQKATLAYDQSPPSATADRKLADFYLGWAKKIPANSQFYRTLQTDAARFVQAARSKDAAGARSGRAAATKAARAAAEKGYQASQAATTAKYEATGQYLNDVLTNVSRANALIGNTGDLRSFQVSDATPLMNFVRGINSNPAAVLYTDSTTGKQTTGADVLAKLHQLDPHFSGKVTLSYFNDTQLRQLQGERIRLALAQTSNVNMAAHKGDASNIKQWISYTTENQVMASNIPVEAKYQVIREDFLNTWQSNTATPDQKLAAWNTYAGRLTSMAGQHGVLDSTRTKLLAEAQGNSNVPNMSESLTDLGNVTSATSVKDTAQTQLDLQTLQQEQAGVASNSLIWTYGTRTPSRHDAQGDFVPSTFTPGAGTDLGAVPLDAAQQASPQGAALMYIQQGDGLKPIPVMVPGVAIRATVLDAAGNVVKATDPAHEVVGIAYQVVENGVAQTVYAIPGGNGKTVYTTQAPWADQSGVTSHFVKSGAGNAHVQLTITLPYVPSAQSVAGNGAFTVTSKGGESVPAYGPYTLGTDKSGNQTATRTVTGLQNTPVVSTITVDPARLTLMLDPARALAGIDPATDSYSPTVALHMTTTDGQAFINQVMADPASQGASIISYDLHRATGYTIDPQTNTWVGGNAQAYAAAQPGASAGAEAQLGVNVYNLIGRFTGAQPISATPTWAAAPHPFIGPPAPTNTGGFTAAGGVRTPIRQSGNQQLLRRDNYAYGQGSAADHQNVMPADLTVGTPFEALGAAFAPGTNRFLPPDVAGTAATTSIKTGSSLRLPGVPDMGASNAVPADKSIVTPLPVPVVPTTQNAPTKPTPTPTPTPLPTPTTPPPTPPTLAAPPPPTSLTPPGPTDSLLTPPPPPSAPAAAPSRLGQRPS